MVLADNYKEGGEQVEEIIPVEPIARQPGFVGRQKELNVFRDWLKSEAGTSTLFVISGMGGVGKNSLLAKINYHAKTGNIKSIPLRWRRLSANSSEFY